MHRDFNSMPNCLMCQMQSILYLQWRIQVFPEGVFTLKEGEANIRFDEISQTLHANDEILATRSNNATAETIMKNSCFSYFVLD